MKKFEEPMFKVIKIESADVIATSLVASEPIFDHDNARKNANDIAQISQNLWF